MMSAWQRVGYFNAHEWVAELLPNGDGVHSAAEKEILVFLSGYQAWSTKPIWGSFLIHSWNRRVVKVHPAPYPWLSVIQGIM